jgi:beta-1,4-galactosyltransferase 4
MKYSIIIPYRDRKKHLQILLPVLLERFKNEQYEIIISEQNDSSNFQIACVENIGFTHAKGDIIVLQQVDYIPTEDVSYEIKNQPVLPARVANFVTDTLEPRSYLDIPAGYRGFSKEVESNFYGGVIVMKREQFERINGLNPLYKGWGNEDEDLRERLKWEGYTPIRNEVGTFICLYHEDNGDIHNQPPDIQKDFTEGRQLYANAFKYKDIGYKNMTWDEEVFNLEGYDNVKWVKSTNYNINENNI